MSSSQSSNNWPTRQAATHSGIYINMHLYRCCRHGTNNRNLQLFSQQMLAKIFKNVVDVAEVVDFPLQTEGYDEIEHGAFAQRAAGCFEASLGGKS
jgi:hypothetical protein